MSSEWQLKRLKKPHISKWIEMFKLSLFIPAEKNQHLSGFQSSIQEVLQNSVIIFHLDYFVFCI